MPRISIITPCYNAQSYVGAMLESVHAQVFTDFEHIVVDDGSTDLSFAILQEWSKSHPLLKLIRQKNGGVSKARNSGFRAATASSEYLLFLDADDCMEPEMLGVLAAYLDENPSVGMVYCNHRFINEHGEMLRTDGGNSTGWTARYVPSAFGVRKLPDDQADTPFLSIYALASIAPSTALIRRSVYERTPAWDENFGQVHEDSDLFLSVSLLSRIHFVARPLLLYRRHPTQSTASRFGFRHQEEKLFKKWATRLDLNAKERRVVAEAAWFRKGRIIPYFGVRAGNSELARGKVFVASRFYIGAARRYFASFLTRSAYCKVYATYRAPSLGNR